MDVVKRFRAPERYKNLPDYFRRWSFSREFIEILNLIIITWRQIYFAMLWINCKSTNLSTQFPVKDKIDFRHKHNLVYYGECPDEGCKDDYVGETKRCIVERINDHSSKDNSSHLLKHTRENGHTHVWEKDFQILANNYESNFNRKISESLFIRQLKPTLNVNKKSITLHLLNWFIVVITLIEASIHWFVQARY